MSISASDPPSFDRLHPEIRRWIREQGWVGLRPIQDEAIRTVFDTEADVVIMAATASGKTEAAFLPLLTRAAEAPGDGLRILYVSPLKALINDQYRRLETLCARLEMPVTRWHGDAPAAAKAKLLRRPDGVALITPESIEALLLRRPADAARLFHGLQAVVIDELHAFLKGPRGLHLASLLRRIDRLCAARPRRIGLSATLGDPVAGQGWLNPAHPNAPVVLRSQDGGAGLKLQVRGYERLPDEKGGDEIADHGAQDALSRIADHMFAHLRGSNNLAFGGSRGTVEALADRLRQRCDVNGVPQEFFPHHGSLAKELREELELRLKTGDLPTTAVATTTLELGIDLGNVRSVAQVGAPRSLAGLRQRLGRSGRRGDPAVLRIYVRERYVAPDTGPLDQLRIGTVRAVAAIRLLLDGFVEPANDDPSLATVILHQTLATIAAEGAMRPADAYRSLCGPGSYLAMRTSDYAALLRGAGHKNVGLFEQSADGLLMLGHEGERITAGRDFYAVFETDDEWRLVAGGRTLGSVPISNVLTIGALIGFVGRRWRIEAVDDRAKVLTVAPHRAGRLPLFDRTGAEAVHSRLSQEMRTVLTADDIPAYLDPAARAFLHEGRTAYRRLGLDRVCAVAWGNDTLFATWAGTSVNDVLVILLQSAGLECEADDVALTVTGCTPQELRRLLISIKDFPSVESLSGFVENLRTAKYDDYVNEDLLRRLWAERARPARAEAIAVLDRLCW